MIKRRTGPVRVALLGCGVVGSKTAQLLTEEVRELSARVGRPLELVAIGDRRETVPGLDTALLTPDLEALVRREDVDGPYAKTLYEKFLWRLFGGNANLFTQFRAHWSDKTKIKEALAAQGRPVLIVIEPDPGIRSPLKTLELTCRVP